MILKVAHIKDWAKKEFSNGMIELVRKIIFFFYKIYKKYFKALSCLKNVAVEFLFHRVEKESAIEDEVEEGTDVKMKTPAKTPASAKEKCFSFLFDKYNSNNNKEINNEVKLALFKAKLDKEIEFFLAIL